MPIGPTPCALSATEDDMKEFTAPEDRTMRHVLGIARAVALALALTASLPRPSQAAPAAPPPVPAEVRVPAGHKPFLVGHAVGTQNYVCLPAGDGVRFALSTPQATLFDGGKQLTTHYFSPNPAESGTVRATWQHSRDTSTVWGQVKPGNASSDPEYVAPGAIPWLLVTVVGAEDGPDGGDKLTKTTFIQRLNTAGGVAPATGCSSPADIGRQAFVPYTTDYYFYKQAN
jgi:hypothetical protein